MAAVACCCCRGATTNVLTVGHPGCGPGGRRREAACALSRHTWRAQYNEDNDRNDTVLVEELLTFDDVAGTFASNVSAYPFQDCDSNWVVWTGLQERTAPDTADFTYVRCTISGPGCLRCGPTSQDVVAVRFSTEACDTLLLQPEGVPAPRTYLPA